MAKDLFADFPKPDFSHWKQRVEKDLRGKDFESLISESREGITIYPLYNHQDAEFSFQPFRNKLDWRIVQEILVMDAKAANAEALDHLNRGANSLLFYLAPQTDLSLLLKDVLIEHVHIHLITEGSDALLVAGQLNEIISQRGLNPEDIHGTINIDPLENLARTGNWFGSEEEDFSCLQQLKQALPQNMRCHCINANLFSHAGASLDQQLGVLLSMSYEYLYRLELKDAKGFWLNTAIGSDFFGEIAKMRALRRLWKQLLEEVGIPDTPAHIYAESSFRNKTIKDAYNNMIRSSAEAMAAIIGGGDEFSVKGFDQTFRAPSAFGERIAKNQQSVLQHESYLDKVQDMAKGSYFIEELSDQLAQKGWEFFKSIEKEGGYIEALKSGWLQQQIETTAHEEQMAFNEKTRVLIGANKYVNSNENLQEIIEYGHFHRPPKNETTVKPLSVKRLSEELEKE